MLRLLVLPAGYAMWRRHQLYDASNARLVQIATSGGP